MYYIVSLLCILICTSVIIKLRIIKCTIAIQEETSTLYSEVSRSFIQHAVSRRIHAVVFSIIYIASFLSIRCTRRLNRVRDGARAKTGNGLFRCRTLRPCRHHKGHPRKRAGNHGKCHSKRQNAFDNPASLTLMAVPLHFSHFALPSFLHLLILSVIFRCMGQYKGMSSPFLINFFCHIHICGCVSPATS